MEPESSLPHLQMSATCPSPEPDQFILSLPSHLLTMRINIILPSTPGSSKWSLYLRLPHQNPVYTFTLTPLCYMTRPSHSSRLITRIILSEKYKSLSSSLCSFLQALFTSNLLGPNIFLTTLFSNTLSLVPPSI